MNIETFVDSFHYDPAHKCLTSFENVVMSASRQTPRHQSQSEGSKPWRESLCGHKNRAVLSKQRSIQSALALTISITSTTFSLKNEAKTAFFFCLQRRYFPFCLFIALTGHCNSELRTGILICIHWCCLDIEVYCLMPDPSQVEASLSLVGEGSIV